MKRLLLTLGLLVGFVASAWAVDSYTPMLNANYSASINDTKIATTVAFTAARTLTLPYSGGTCIGQSCNSANGVYPFQTLEFFDLQSAITSVNTLTIAPQSGDTINGSSSSLVISSPNAHVVMYPLSGSNWYVQVGALQGQIPGTTTNDNAATGNVGEYVTGSVTSTNNVALAPIGTQKIVTSAQLTAGDWDCRGVVGNVPASTNVLSTFTVWTSTSALAIPLAGLDAGTMTTVTLSPAVGFTPPLLELPTPVTRYSFAATTSVNLLVSADWNSATMSAYGFLGCRRVR